MMLALFMSLWIIPFLCASSRPSATCREIFRASSSSNGPFSIFALNVCPSTYSMAIKDFPSSSSISWIVQILGWDRAAAA
jgi:hypothetical protein